jgi:hypothetical protein
MHEGRAVPERTGVPGAGEDEERGTFIVLDDVFAAVAANHKVVNRAGILDEEFTRY